MQVVEQQQRAFEVLADGLEQPPALVAGGVHEPAEDLGAERLLERLVGRDLLLVAAAVAHGRAALVRAPPGLGEQARLADPGLAGEQDRAAAGRVE